MGNYLRGQKGVIPFSSLICYSGLLKLYSLAKYGLLPVQKN